MMRYEVETVLFIDDDSGYYISVYDTIEDLYYANNEEKRGTGINVILRSLGLDIEYRDMALILGSAYEDEDGELFYKNKNDADRIARVLQRLFN